MKSHLFMAVTCGIGVLVILVAFMLGLQGDESASGAIAALLLAGSALPLAGVVWSTAFRRP